MENHQVEPGKELVYVDGVNGLRNQGKTAYAVEVKGGKYYDCGNITEYLKTNVELALKRPELREEFKQFLRKTVDSF